MPNRPLRRRALGWLAAACAVGAASVPAWSASAGPVFGSGAPAFAVYAAPSSLPSANNAGEPSIGVDWRTGAAMFMAGTSTYRVSFDDRTSPPAASWSDVSSTYSQLNLDPILATDAATGLTLAGGDDGPCSLLSASSDDGASWRPVAPCSVLVDHPTVGIGPFAGAVPVGATGTRIAYYCQQYPVLDECARSLDGGATWSPGTPVSGGCISLTGHVKVARDGTAYLPIRSCSTATSTDVGGGLSTDNGLTWTSYAIPDALTPAAGFDPSVGTTSDNTVYESWARAGDYHPVITWSHNRGVTWAPQVDLAGTVHPALTASTFQAVVGGNAGQVAVAYLGSAVPVPAGSTPFDSTYHGVWYLYVSFSYDGGRTWRTVRATPTPVQRGYLCSGGTSCLAGRNLLDFMDASLTPDGRVVVGYANGCLANSGCAGPDGTAAQSVDAWATIARQTAGRGLLR